MSPVLTFSHVSFSYEGNTRALEDISFSIDKGEKVALLGLNGAGKSTLMLHTNGLLLPESGEVLVNGLSTRGKEIREIRKLVGMVFQNSDDQLFMPTVWDDIAFGPRNMGLSESEIAQRVEEAMKLTLTTHLARRCPFELSGGEKKAVSIATVLSMRPEILVMDEPTAGMDARARQNFISLVESLPQALLLSTHDLELASTLCSRSLNLSAGRLLP